MAHGRIALSAALALAACAFPSHDDASTTSDSALQASASGATIYAWARLGLGEPVVDNAILKKGWDVDAQLDKILALKPQIFRLWFTADFLYDASGTPSDAHMPLFKQAIARLGAAGVPIMGMQHSFPPWMTGADGSVKENWNTIPCLNAGDPYTRFLDKYEENWGRMAQWFPEVAIWEPANETNGADSLKPIQSGAGSCGKAFFSHDERVFITIQLMERAHRAIKKSAPKALVFLPPPGPMNDELALSGAFGTVDTPLVTIQRFIGDVYSAIASWQGSPRSYFDGISWHPYIFQDATQATWVEKNQAIYQTITSHGDGQIPIIFSEVGNSEMNYLPATRSQGAVSPDALASWMQDTIRLSQEKLPWLTHLIWFRAFDDQIAAGWGKEFEEKFGIVHDDRAGFAKKPSTDVFCKFAGCVNEPFRAYVAGGGWSAFWLNGDSYCQYQSPAQFKARTGMDLMTNFPFLAAIDPSQKTYVGFCQ